jgi:hypothetical protein
LFHIDKTYHHDHHDHPFVFIFEKKKKKKKNLHDCFGFQKTNKLPSHELITSIAAGKCHSMALTIYGDAYAWGKNWYGELGSGDKDLTPTPVMIGRNKSKPLPEPSDEFGFSRVGTSSSTSGRMNLTRGKSAPGGGGGVNNTGGGFSLGLKSRGGLETSGSVRPPTTGIANLMQSKRRDQTKDPTATTTATNKVSNVSVGEKRAQERLDNIDMESGPVFLKLSGGDRHSVSLALKGRPPHLKREAISARGVKGLR